MKWFEIRMVVVSVLGFCLLLAVDVPTARADFTFGTPSKYEEADIRTDDLIGCFSPDGLEMYITSSRAGGQGAADLWMLKRASVNENWGPPENLGPIVNSLQTDAFPSISADGLTLYFNSRRPGGYGGMDIWMTARTTRESPWGTPQNLGPAVNSSSDDGGPCISPDGLELYFCSWRLGGYGSSDLYVTRRPTKDSPWEPASNLGPLINSSGSEAGTSLSPDGLVLVFGGEIGNPARPGGYGNADIWMTTRTAVSAPWSTPTNLGLGINSSSHETVAVISPDGYTLYFHSNRPHGSALSYGELYQAPILPVVDFNGDGVVDTKDLVKLIDSWGQADPLCDIGPFAWGDGVVDEADLEVFMRYWGQQVDDPTLIGHWPLDEAEGTVAYDLAGGNDATILFGAPQWHPEGGKIDGALELPGMAFARADSPVNPAHGPFSVLAWVQGGAPGEVIIAQQEGANWLMADPATGALITELGPGGRGSPRLISDAVITDGAWHRIAFTWDGTNRRLYVDDVLVAADMPAGLPSSFGNLVFGAGAPMAPTTFWTGMIDEIRIYNRIVWP